MLTLLLKDFKLMFGKKTSAAKRIISAVFAIVFLGCFVALELFLFDGVLQKISSVKGAAEAFLCIFLFVITILLIVSMIFQAKKLFFDPLDIEMLSMRPISNGQVVASKMILLFFIHYALAFVFEYPLLVAYGEIQGLSPLYFYKAIFYPALSFIFEAGVALILLYPAWLLSRFLKNRQIAKLIIATVVMAVLTYFYSIALNIFTNLVASNNIMALFTAKRVQSMITFREYALPVNFLMDVFVGKSGRALLLYLLISSGILVLGLSITIYAYNYVRNVSFSAKIRNKERKISVTSATKALIRKELTLIFKDSDYIFSFTGLLIVQPFLLSLVVNAMNTVFNSGTMVYYTTFLPSFVPAVDIFFVMVFSTTIAQGASSYITMEKRTVKNMKTIPVSYKKQLFIKLSIPFVLSATSMFVSIISLTVSGILRIDTAIVAFLAAICVLLTYDLISLIEELSIRHGKERKTALSSAYSYVMPLLFSVAVILLAYVGLNLYLCYLIGIVVIMATAAPIVYHAYRNGGKLFLELEAVN